MLSSSPDESLDHAEAKAAFQLRMRARGIRHLDVLRAFELVPRRIFVPHRYLDLAARDLPLPIGCGQTLDPPWLIGRMIEALGIARSHRVLQIGAGTGYATAILSHLAREVTALERFQSLASAAQDRLDALGIGNAAIVWGDGLALPPDLDLFDRILVHGALVEGPVGLTAALGETGRIVCARPNAAGQELVTLTKTPAGIAEEALGPCRLQPIQAGLSSAL